MKKIDPQYLFSIVIPAYNYAHTLERAVVSVLSQKTHDVELIVIDDGSTDSTDVVISRLQQAYPDQIVFIKTENQGLSATRNRGVDESSGCYLVFLDADDELIENGVGILRDGIGRAPEAQMIVGGHISVHESGKEVYHSVDSIPVDAPERLQGYLLEKTTSLSNGAVAMHRNIFDQYRYKVEFKSSEDIPMFAFVLANYHVATASGAVVKIHKHSGSLRHNVELAKAVGETLVEEVFDSSRMPGSVMWLKKPFAVQRYLSLSRTCFISKDYSGCCGYYRRAYAEDWRVIFKLTYTRKAFCAGVFVWIKPLFSH